VLVAWYVVHLGHAPRAASLEHSGQCSKEPYSATLDNNLNEYESWNNTTSKNEYKHRV
jgi:hypothetical protein